MKVIGIISSLVGAVLVSYGIYLNNNREALYEVYMSYNPTRLPGAGYTTIGMMCFILGLALFVASYLRNSKSTNINTEKIYCPKCGEKLSTH